MPGTDRRLEKGSLSLSAEVTVCLFNPSSQIIGISGTAGRHRAELKQLHHPRLHRH